MSQCQNTRKNTPRLHHKRSKKFTGLVINYILFRPSYLRTCKRDNGGHLSGSKYVVDREPTCGWW